MGTHDLFHRAGANTVLVQLVWAHLLHRHSCLAQLYVFLLHASADRILHHISPDYFDCIHQRHILFPSTGPKNWLLGTAIHCLTVLGSSNRQLRGRRH